MQLTPVCDPFPHCVLLAPTTDSSKMHTQVSCLTKTYKIIIVLFTSLCLRPAFFCFFVINRFFISISKFSDTEFSSLTSKKPAYCFLLKADKCTLSLREITVCASKHLFLLVTKKESF